jgi:hypothetical protein
MNLNGLARNYHWLTPRERLSLIIAAADRGDDAEADRLARSASMVLHKLKDYHGLAEGLTRMALFHIIEQLQLVVMLAVFWGKSRRPDETSNRQEGGDEEIPWLSLAQGAAYTLVVEADAWKVICDELRIEPEAQLRDLPGYDLVKPHVEAARGIAFTQEQATATLRALRGDAAQARTLESAVGAMRSVFDFWANWWDVPPEGPPAGRR